MTVFFGDGTSQTSAAGASKLVQTVTANSKTSYSFTSQTYANTDVFIYDDGYGNLFGACGTGSSINYETGAVDIIGCPPEANFVVSALYNGPLSGRQSATHTKRNGLTAIYGNLTSQKGEGEITITRR